MIFLKEIEPTLIDLGSRLRRARIDSGQSQVLFAERIGISVPTLRAMEQGRPTVMVGQWALALWALNALDDLHGVLVQRPSLLEQLESKRPVRERAARRSLKATAR